jgi:hypothetical protein
MFKTFVFLLSGHSSYIKYTQATLVPSYKESHTACQIYAAEIYSMPLTCNLFWSLSLLLVNGLESDIPKIIVFSYPLNIVSSTWTGNFFIPQMTSMTEINRTRSRNCSKKSSLTLLLCVDISL